MFLKHLLRPFLILREATRMVFTSQLSYSSRDVPVTSIEFYRRPLPRHCIAFSSPEGKLLFREALLAGHMEAYFALAAQLCTQAEPAYCGLATLVMILNALEMDPGRVWKGPWRWYHETMLTCCVDSNVLTEGIVMDKFAEVARCNGLNVEIHRVHPNSMLSDFRDLVSRMTSSDHSGFLVSCYDRGTMGQTGTGHFAAVGGYHPQRELVFLFDTARFKYPSHWVPLARLFESMSRVDPATQQPRGYLILTRATALQNRPEAIKCPSLTEESQPNPFGPTNLVLFDISHSAWQAFLSPAALGDSRSIGYRLRRVSDAWLQWLQTPVSSEDASDDDALIQQASQFLLNTCAMYNPGSFFLTIQPMNDMSSRNEHELLHGLLSSRVGRVVARVVSEIPQDVLNALTGDSATFRLAVGRGFGTGSLPTPDVNALCPFVELKDASLRLTVFLTCFLIFSARCACSAPSSQTAAATTTITRQQSLLRLFNQLELPGPVCSELVNLQTLFCFLLRSALTMDHEAVVHCRRWNPKHHESS